MISDVSCRLCIEFNCFLVAVENGRNPSEFPAKTPKSGTCDEVIIWVCLKIDYT
jgi:hypothetical protein